MGSVTGSDMVLLLNWYEQIVDVSPEWLEERDHRLARKMRQKVKAMERVKNEQPHHTD